MTVDWFHGTEQQPLLEISGIAARDFVCVVESDIIFYCRGMNEIIPLYIFMVIMMAPTIQPQLPHTISVASYSNSTRAGYHF